MNESTLIKQLDKAEGRNEEIVVLVTAGWKYVHIVQALDLKSHGTVSGVMARMKARYRRSKES